MVTTEELRAAVHRKADEADESTLIEMLSVDLSRKEDAQYKLSEADLAELHLRIERYKSGQSKGHTLEEVVQQYRDKRGNGL